MKISYFIFSLLTITFVKAQPYGLEERIPNNSLLLSTGTDTLSQMRLEPVFENLDFSLPVGLKHANDSTHRLFLIEKKGRIVVFENNPSTSDSKIFLDISQNVNSTPNEAGLLGLAFHPDYINNGKFYVSYTFGSLTSRISEFLVSSNPDSADPGSERILLELDQPYNNHNGGDLAFGPDGYLYIGFGDGGSSSDPLRNSQNTHTLHGAILRIDINQTTDSTSYAIPVDNPFASHPKGGRPEIWAWGLRNPWRFSFDPITGYLWTGDVGQNKWEEVDIIEGGKNYGWNIMEGFHCYRSATCDTTGLTLPIIEYDHDTGRSITGGYVYRSTRLSRLNGVYLYGDYVTRRIWGLKYSGNSIEEHALIAESPSSISAFGIDANDEVYVIGYDGRIFCFEEPDDVPIISVPQSISTSGLYSDIGEKIISPGIIPYSVNISFWSDGAYKERFIALPDISKIHFSKDSIWSFPDNSVLVKNFYLERESGNTESRQIVETRFLVRYADEENWNGYSYIWNDEETDAFLLDSSATKTFMIIDGDSSYNQEWYFPSRSECLVCHTPATGYVLGLRTAQINKTHQFAAIEDNQLRSYNHIGLFHQDIGENYADFPKFPQIDDSSANLELRARSYLDVNCANCHVTGGAGRTNLDLRYNIPLVSAHMIGIPASLENLNIENAMRIQPGQPDSSILFLRMVRNDEHRMPPLASSIIDTQGSKLIREWIDSLGTVTAGETETANSLSAYSLHQAYPNPFNAQTIIEFSIPESSTITLTLYDITGKQIQKLVDTYLAPGNYSYKFHAGDLTSGIYVYQLKAKTFSTSKKLILLK